MNEAHEIRIDGDRAWCETCDWTAVDVTYFPTSLQAFFHFSDPEPAQTRTPGVASPSWAVCEFCTWPDRVWPSGRPGGDLGVTRWPRPAKWQWEIRGRDKDCVLACEEHEHLGPSGKPNAYKLLLHAS
jgi:hypothetical protein